MIVEHGRVSEKLARSKGGSGGGGGSCWMRRRMGGGETRIHVGGCRLPTEEGNDAVH